MALEDTILSEIELPGGRTEFRNFVGQAGTFLDGPQAYLVIMPEVNNNVPPHFHDIDQFQVVLSGEGHFGKKPWRPGGVQYADAYTPYGPIIAHEGGISFYTLRVASSSGQYGMPGSAHLRIEKRSRFAAGAQSASGDMADVPLGESVIIARRSDGLCALGWRLLPAERLVTPDSRGGGQYFIVQNGCVIVDGRELGKGGLVFFEAGESAATLVAGALGAVITMVEFPRASARFGSDPEELAKRDRSVPYAIAHAN